MIVGKGCHKRLWRLRRFLASDTWEVWRRTEISNQISRLNPTAAANAPYPLHDAALQVLDQVLPGYAPLLTGLPYADWPLEPRQRLEDLYLEGCLYVAEVYLSRRQWEAGQAWLRRALQTAPWLEREWQLLIRLYARQGQRALALKAYQDTVTVLERELGIRPSELTI